MLKAGLDIGGTKCAAVLGRMESDGAIHVIGRAAFATREAAGPVDCLECLCNELALAGSQRFAFLYLMQD